MSRDAFSSFSVVFVLLRKSHKEAGERGKERARGMMGMGMFSRPLAMSRINYNLENSPKKIRALFG